MIAIRTHKMINYGSRRVGSRSNCKSARWYDWSYRAISEYQSERKDVLSFANNISTRHLDNRYHAKKEKGFWNGNGVKAHGDDSSKVVYLFPRKIRFFLHIFWRHFIGMRYQLKSIETCRWGSKLSIIISIKFEYSLHI